MKILSSFLFFWVILPSWIRIRISNFYADPDPDPTAQINADLCGSGSETLFLSLLDPDPDPLVRGTNPAPDPSIIKQK
jgi:hypothetical protein